MGVSDVTPRYPEWVIYTICIFDSLRNSGLFLGLLGGLLKGLIQQHYVNILMFFTDIFVGGVIVWVCSPLVSLYVHDAFYGVVCLTLGYAGADVVQKFHDKILKHIEIRILPTVEDMENIVKDKPKNFTGISKD